MPPANRMSRTNLPHFFIFKALGSRRSVPVILLLTLYYIIWRRRLSRLKRVRFNLKLSKASEIQILGLIVWKLLQLEIIVHLKLPKWPPGSRWRPWSGSNRVRWNVPASPEPFAYVHSLALRPSVSTSTRHRIDRGNRGLQFRRHARLSNLPVPARKRGRETQLHHNARTYLGRFVNS